MRSIRDSQLPEPFRSWIDKQTPLPTEVTFFPRRIDVSSAAWRLASVGGPCLVMGGLFGYVLWVIPEDFSVGRILFFVLAFSFLLGIPTLLARRLWHAIVASRDRKANSLRFGIFLASDGLLARLNLNQSFLITWSDFLIAEDWSGSEDIGNTLLTIKTKKGEVDLNADYLQVDARSLNEAVYAIRNKKRGN